MPEFIAIHVEDVLRRPIANARVQVDFFDGSGPRAVNKPTNPPQPGSVQIACPTSPKATRVRVLVAEQPELWEIDVTFPITRKADGTPHVQLVPHLNVVGLMTHDRGRGDFTMHVRLAMCALKDGSAEALHPSLGGSNATFRAAVASPEGFASKNFSYNDTPPPNSFVLDSFGKQPFVVHDTPDRSGWNRINRTPSAAHPVGRVYFAHRKAPQGSNLLVVWRPAIVDLATPTTRADVDLDFHVFFHPAIRGDSWGPVYPFGAPFINLAQRYLFTQMHLVAQHVLPRKKVILVFPVGSKAHQMGDLNQWSPLMRALNELKFFMHQIDGAGSIAAGVRQIGRVALSGISFGIQFVEPLIAQSDERLREVYSFDGVDAHGGSATFVQAMTAWLSNPAGPRKFFKIYTQDPANLHLQRFCVQNPSDPKQKPLVKTKTFTSNVVHGGKTLALTSTTTEVHDDWTNPTRTIACLPHVYWEQLPPAKEGTLDDNKQPMGPHMRYYDTVHHIIAYFFAHHAILHSGFRG